MNKTLINFLVKIKNASLLGKQYVRLNYNISYLKVLKILYREGFIQSIKVDVKSVQVIVHLRFYEQKKLINEIKFLSKPSHQRFISFFELTLINDKNVFILLSTDKGLLTLSQCKKQKVGGKLLFSIN